MPGHEPCPGKGRLLFPGPPVPVQKRSSVQVPESAGVSIPLANSAAVGSAGLPTGDADQEIGATFEFASGSVSPAPMRPGRPRSQEVRQCRVRLLILRCARQPSCRRPVL
jgi:hypothetical protein